VPKATQQWPEGCREVVATLAPATPEARVLIRAPHHRTAAGFEPAELSSRLGSLLKRVGERGEVGRAFGAALRESRAPTSPAAGRTQAERASGMDRVARFRVDDPGAAERLASLLRSSGIAESSHPVAALRTDELEREDDDSLPSLKPGGWAVRIVRGDEALDLEPGSSRVVVAVLDTGIEPSHREFRRKLVPGYDFVDMPAEGDLIGDVGGPDAEPTDEAGHGTHVAGTIGAIGVGMPRGLGGECRLMAVRVLGTMVEQGNRVGVGEVPNIDDGIKFAVDEGADVINMSLGLPAIGSGIPHRRAIEYARLHNVVVVAASGNDGMPRPLYPGGIPGVITVGAINELGRVAPFSSFGPFLDVVAPGTGIYSADLGGGYRSRSGTSHAAPFVAGIAALVISRARRQGLTLGERTVRRIIRDTVDRSDERSSDEHSGRGAVNALDAVLLTSHLIRAHLGRQREDRWRGVARAGELTPAASE
jgi:thermitase